MEVEIHLVEEVVNPLVEEVVIHLNPLVEEVEIRLDHLMKAIQLNHRVETQQKNLVQMELKETKILSKWF